MEADKNPDDPQDEFLILTLRYFQRHCWIFSFSSILATIIMITLDQWWLFWPLAIWASTFLIHYLIVKSLKVDNEWVEDRTLNTAYYAYDLDHIVNIRNKNENKANQKEPSEK